MSAATSGKSKSGKSKARKSSTRTRAPKSAETPDVSVDEQKALLNQEIEKDEKLAESEWELAEWFTQNGRVELALRRWQKILDNYPLSSFCPRAAEKLAEHKPGKSARK
ncbi:MAG: hypothetical protein U0903_03245 [Planctomycetales bacterium]